MVKWAVSGNSQPMVWAICCCLWEWIRPKVDDDEEEAEDPQQEELDTDLGSKVA